MCGTATGMLKHVVIDEVWSKGSAMLLAGWWWWCKGAAETVRDYEKTGGSRNRSLYGSLPRIVTSKV